MSQCSCQIKFKHEPDWSTIRTPFIERCAHCVAADALLRDALHLIGSAFDFRKPDDGDEALLPFSFRLELKAILSRAIELGLTPPSPSSPPVL